MQPQYPQMLRALAMQRLGAGDTAQGTVRDWGMISQSMRAQATARPGSGDPLGPAPPSKPGPYDPLGRGGAVGIRPIAQFGEQIRQRLALKMARTGRPPMVAPRGAADPAKFMRGSMGA